MMNNRTYQTALMIAVLFHIGLALAFMIHPKNARPVLKSEARHVKRSTPETQEIVKAVSVNTTEVTAMMNQLKAEKQAKANAEIKQQKKLAAAADAARTRRVQEQRKLERLRAEHARAAKKQKQLALAEANRLKAVQKQQVVEAQKLQAIKKQQAAEKARAITQAKLEKERIEAANRARMSGVVDKYKALILGAIGQQWIVPDQVNKTLSSRFKIRLAPNGAVLDVQLTRSSGDPVLDRSAQAAIYKASPLPVPSEPDVFNQFREISLTVRPENVRG
jgi:colicin import membrane protein